MTMRRRVVVTLIALFALVSGATGAAMAQTATGQITGVVKDANGAVMAKARVKVSSALTGLTRETTTNEEGIYVFPLLPVSVYSVTVEQQGFRAARKANISINVDQIVRADFDLTIGDVSAVVEVESGAVALDSETASIGQIVSQRQVNDLPLNGRNFLQLLFIGAGAVQTDGEQGTMRQGAGNAISINGSRPTSNNYLLDGTSNTDTALGTPAVILSVDAIQEFKEQTATYSAEYGFSANQVNIVSKTGTNNLHGTAFWFGRNDALDANDYFNNLAGSPKSKLRQNQFGFVAGGPVWVPKLYNGRDKSFWLVNYEGARIRRGFQSFNWPAISRQPSLTR
jgi:Carboxypeptidase regulatory-like domain